MTNLFSTAAAVSPGAEFDVAYPTTVVCSGFSSIGERILLEIQRADLSYDPQMSFSSSNRFKVITAPDHYRVSKLATAGVVSVDYGS